MGQNEDPFYSAGEIEYENQNRLEEEEDLNVLTFEDLLCFAYQVAKGMEFLEFKSVSSLKKLTTTKDNFEKERCALFLVYFNIYSLVCLSQPCPLLESPRMLPGSWLIMV